MKKVLAKQKGILMSLFAVFGLFLSGCQIDTPTDVKVGTASLPGAISGQVVNGETQQAVEGLTVVVNSLNRKTTKTDKYGRFAVEGLEVTQFSDGDQVAPIPIVPGGAGHLVTITDERKVGTGDKKIAAETDRLAMYQARVHITLPPSFGGQNQVLVSDMGVIGLNVAESINVVVTTPGGVVAPDGVTVIAFSDGSTNAESCFASQTQLGVVPVLGTGGAVPISATTGSGDAGAVNATGTGVAILGGLDKCLEYTILVPAQVVGGVQMVTAAFGSFDLATIEDNNGSTTIALTLVAAVFDEVLGVIASNMAPDAAHIAVDVTAFDGTPLFAAGTNVSSVGANPGTALALTNPTPSYTATPTQSLVVVFNLPVVLETDSNGQDVVLNFTDNLRDPDVDADDVLELGGDDSAYAAIVSLGGTPTAALDTTGTILTISHATAFVANQFYTMNGQLRTAGSNVLTALNTLGVGGNGVIYVSDGDATTGVPSSSTIVADNLDGNSAAVMTGTPNLVFNEAVAGRGRLVSITADGVTTTVNGANFAIIASGLTRILSTIGPSTTDACDLCLATNGAKVFMAIPGTGAMNDDGANDNVVVYLDVVDVSGNRFAGNLTLAIQ